MNQIQISIVSLYVCVALATSTNADVLFESGTLGPTGITWQQVNDQVVLGENVSPFAFTGVRFEIKRRAFTSQVGGHLVGSPDGDMTLFAAIVELESATDFPDSNDLSTPDVLGTTLLAATNVSQDVVGSLSRELSPGWYALIFGSGQYGAEGIGAALLNNADIGSPDYIGFLAGFDWGNRLPGKHFFVAGEFVPESTSFAPAFLSFLVLLGQRSSLTRRLA